MILFPTSDDLVRIRGHYGDAFTSLDKDEIMNCFDKHHPDTLGLVASDAHTLDLMISNAITWSNSYNRRTEYSQRSFAFMHFYFEQHLPEHDNIKELDAHTIFARDFFYYYADVLLYQAFSAWDILAHVIDLILHLKVKKPDFSSVMDTLKKRGKQAYTQLELITTNPAYKAAKELRNEFAHNVPGGVPDNRPQQVESIRISGSDITLKNPVAYGTNTSTSPSKVVGIISGAMPLLERTKQIVVELTP